MFASRSGAKKQSGSDKTRELGITVVDDEESAKRALDVLYSKDVRSRFHACDTEVTDITLKRSPYGQGHVTCATVFAGPDIDFGTGPKLFIENLDRSEGILNEFKDYFEDPTVKKVWHNYSFDRAVLFNHGISCAGLGGDTMHMARLWHSARSISGGYSLENLTAELLNRRKVPMKERFGRRQLLKSGLPGKILYLPPSDELQRDPDTRDDFIDYATYDAEVTWYLRNKLQERLEMLSWQEGTTMWNFYVDYYAPFGQLLTDMEAEGFKVRVTDFLPEIQKQAEVDIEKAAERFKKWAASIIPEAKHMNHQSTSQLQAFFFSRQPKHPFKYPNVDGYIAPGDARPKKDIPFRIKGLGMKPLRKTATGLPEVGSKTLRDMAGKPHEDPPQYGPLYDFFGKAKEGRDACLAVDSLLEVSFLHKMQSTFIEPLIEMADHEHRVHANLNINTETGRLSCRNPNLQNQPALEKDVYKIRSAFTCEEGNILLVCDYGQLELRVLAHMTNCKSMIEAFQSGGDFHSRTAMGMYDEVAAAVAKNEVLLEWDYRDGDPPKPLLKDVYGAERRKAKTLNFSIAYGKTAFGLAKDWGVTKDEAKDTLERWYADRPEVKRWQDNVIVSAHRNKSTRTLMGRYRPLGQIASPDQRTRSHYERAAINTPIQGGAADIVMMAMIKIHSNPRLRALGYRLIMQIHDEVILEGPEEHSEEAMAVLKKCMERPFTKPLRVDLVVDGDAAKTWYEAK